MPGLSKGCHDVSEEVLEEGVLEEDEEAAAAAARAECEMLRFEVGVGAPRRIVLHAVLEAEVIVMF